MHAKKKLSLITYFACILLPCMNHEEDYFVLECINDAWITKQVQMVSSQFGITIIQNSIDCHTSFLVMQKTSGND